MPLFGSAGILNKPRFASTFDVTRNVQSVNNYGEAVNTPTVVRGVVGNVVPLGSRELLVLPEGERQQGQITVTTQYMLRAGSVTDATTADVVTWNSNDYTVVGTNDYSQYGAGFVQARCKLKMPQGA